MNMKSLTLLFLSLVLVACNGVTPQISNSKNKSSKGLATTVMSQVAGGDTTVAVNTVAPSDVKESQEFTLPLQKRGN